MLAESAETDFAVRNVSTEIAFSYAAEFFKGNYDYLFELGKFEVSLCNKVWS